MIRPPSRAGEGGRAEARHVVQERTGGVSTRCSARDQDWSSPVLTTCETGRPSVPSSPDPAVRAAASWACS
ncbi:hypothetical protein SUDANB15_05657 [Streptomyces sp. enrichment culture]